MEDKDNAFSSYSKNFSSFSSLYSFLSFSSYLSVFFSKNLILLSTLLFEVPYFLKHLHFLKNFTF